MDKHRVQKFKKDYNKLQQDDPNDSKIVEALLKARAKMKGAGQLWKSVRDYIRGYSIESKEEYIPSDLIKAAATGNYNLCIDIMEHPFNPVGNK